MTDPQFAPLPVRSRGALEIFDTGLKILRRYFGVLLAWSALSCLPWLIPFVGWAIYFFTLPLVFGAASCVMAAAVRGQKVGFGQIWNFTKPRYGALLGVLFLSVILMIALSFGTTIASTMIFGFGALLLDKMPELLQTIIGVVGYILVLVVSSLISCLAFGWLTMGGVISCLEDNHRGTSALGRASSLMAGNWKRVLGVCSVLTIVLTIFSTLFIIAFFYALIAWFGNAYFGSGDIWDSIFSSIYWFFLLVGVVLTFWMPPQLLIIAVLYLDLRVKKEALDLEWTNYSTAPIAPPTNANANDFGFAPQSPPQIAENPISTSTFGAGSVNEAPPVPLPQMSQQNLPQPSLEKPISLEKPVETRESAPDTSTFAPNTSIFAPPSQAPNSNDAPQNPA